MARGGQRAGTPGRAYANRTDMHQPVKTPDGMEYGKRKMLEEAQKVIPLPTQPSATGGAPPAASTPQVVPQPGLSPGEMDFARPTERPQEPVTAGLPMGPGAGPEALNLPDDRGTTAAYLRTMYANVPDAQNPDFLRLVELAEQEAWQ